MWHEKRFRHVPISRRKLDEFTWFLILTHVNWAYLSRYTLSLWPRFHEYDELMTLKSWNRQVTNWWWVYKSCPPRLKRCKFRYVQNKARSMYLFPFYMMKIQPRYDARLIKNHMDSIFSRLNLHHTKREQVHWMRLVLFVSHAYLIWI